MQKLLFLLALVFVNCSWFAQSAAILESKKKMLYEVRYIDSVQKIKIVDTLSFEITTKPWRFDTVRQRTVVWRRHTNKITPAVKNKIYCLSNMRIDSAAAFETQDEYWLNLPRSDYFAILQIAPGARFIKAARVNDVYNSVMKIGPGWGIYENMELVNSYKAIRRGAIQVKGVSFLYLQIDAEATCKFGTNKVSYYYHEQLGFVGADYSFYNHVTISIKLLSVE